MIRLIGITRVHNFSQWSNICHIAKARVNPEVFDVHDEKQKQQRAKQSHRSAVPFTSFISEIDFISLTSSRQVFRFQNISLDNMNEKHNEQSHFNDPDHYCIAHEVS